MLAAKHLATLFTLLVISTSGICCIDNVPTLPPEEQTDLATITNCVRPHKTEDKPKISFGIDLEDEEVVFRTIPGSKFKEDTSFTLRQGVPVKVMAGSNNSTSAVLLSPSGKATKLENLSYQVKGHKGLLVQHEFTPNETGVWKVLVQDAKNEEYGVLVSRERSDTVAMDSWLEHEVIGIGETAKLQAYVYDPQQEKNDDIDMPKTVKYNSLAVKATIMRPDKGIDVVTLRDDGTGGDKEAGDGIYTATYPTKSREGQYAVLFSAVVDGHTQLSNSFPKTLAVTKAKKSRLLGVSTKPTVRKNEWGEPGDVVFGVSANVSKAGKYFVIAYIADKDGHSIRAVHSTRTTTSQPGKIEMLVTLEADYMRQQADVLPLHVKSASLYVVDGDDEHHLGEKTLDEVVHYAAP